MKIIFWLPIVILLSSCNNNTSKTKSDDDINVADSIYKVKTSDFLKSNNATYIQDSTIKYTYQLQERCKAHNNTLSFKGRIRDVFYKDTNYIAIVNCNYKFNSCIAEIVITNEQLKGILNHKKGKEASFLISASSIKSNSLLNVDSYVEEPNEGEQAESNLTYDFKNVILIIQGKLIDYLYDQD